MRRLHLALSLVGNVVLPEGAYCPSLSVPIIPALFKGKANTEAPMAVDALHYLIASLIVILSLIRCFITYTCTFSLHIKHEKKV